MSIENNSDNPTAQLVGSVELSVRALSLWSAPSGPVPYISNLAVAPAFRRQGVGRRLLLACEPTVRAWGLQEIYLHVLTNNQPALQLYKSLGYQVQKDDSHWTNALLGQPQRLLLHKPL